MQQRAASREKGAEIAAKVDVGKVAEKVVKNVRVLLRTSFWETGAEVADRERESRQPRTRSSLRSPARCSANFQLWNYLHSFGDAPLTPQTPIPLSVFQKWYDNFTRKLGNDRGASFLDRED